MALEKLWQVTLKRKDLATRTIERLRTQVYEPAKANFTGESGFPREVPGQTYDEEAGEQFQREVADLEDPEWSEGDRQGSLIP